MSEGPLLVVGATGRTGRLIVGRLVERRVPVRALVRDAAKGREVLPPGVPQFVGDVRRGETLSEPMAGVRSLIIAACGTAERENSAVIVDYHGTRNVIRQAAAAGVDLVVFVSTIYASHPEHYQDVEPTSLGWKARAEEIIRSSGVPYCIVRSGWLTDGRGGEPLAVSQGDTAEGRISRADLADVCTQLLFAAGARGKTFEVVAAPAGQATGLASAVTALTPDSTQQTPDAERVTLRDGSTVMIRPLTPGDEAAIASWFAGLGAETRYARFFAWLDRLDRRTQSELAHVDHQDHEAVGAVAPDGTTVGIARYIRTDEPRVAEVAVAVADAWRGLGIASILLKRVAASARAAGIERFTAMCLATNHTVIRLLSRLGPTTIGPPDAGLVELRIDLTNTDTDPSTAPTAGSQASDNTRSVYALHQEATR